MSACRFGATIDHAGAVEPRRPWILDRAAQWGPRDQIRVWIDQELPVDQTHASDPQPVQGT